jgi:hypothetical protein
MSINPTLRVTFLSENNKIILVSLKPVLSHVQFNALDYVGEACAFFQL